MRISALFAIIALIALFFKLPGIPGLLGIANCPSCSPSNPYFLMLAAAYFSACLTCILCFRSFPSRSFKYAGLVWSIGLAGSLIYLNPSWCTVCLIAHACHIGMWIFWRSTQEGPEEMIGMKISIIFTASIAVMALFSTLNFTLLIYGFQVKNTNPLVKTGAKIKPFTLETLAKSSLSSDSLSQYKGAVLNFVSASCLYCKEQIPKLDEIADEFEDSGIRFINVSNQLLPDLIALGPHSEWVEDPLGNLEPPFGVTVYPTMVILDSKGIVIESTIGSSIDFKNMLKNQLNLLAQR